MNYTINDTHVGITIALFIGAVFFTAVIGFLCGRRCERVSWLKWGQTQKSESVKIAVFNRLIELYAEEWRDNNHG